MSKMSALESLYDQGWVVAVHNDYRLNGGLFTFWGFTRGNEWIKGEGISDEEAQEKARDAAYELDVLTNSQELKISAMQAKIDVLFIQMKNMNIHIDEASLEELVNKHLS